MLPVFARVGLSIIAAYLLGSLPMGIFFVRAYTGKDVRLTGSGRVGGTNAMRAAGFTAGLFTTFSDMAKGFAGVYLARLIVPDLNWVEALCGIAVVAGHNWSIFIRFKGGAGAATNIGAATAMWPFTAPLFIVIGSIVLLTTGYASVTTTTIAVGIPIMLAILSRVIGLPAIYVVYGVGTLILIALALVGNYRRLLNGTERVVGPRAKAMAARKERNGIAPSGA